MLRTAFAAAYALAYLVGGERRMLRLIRRYGPIMTMPILSLGNVASPGYVASVAGPGPGQ